MKKIMNLRPQHIVWIYKLKKSRQSHIFNDQIKITQRGLLFIRSQQNHSKQKNSEINVKINEYFSNRYMKILYFNLQKELFQIVINSQNYKQLQLKFKKDLYLMHEWEFVKIAFNLNKEYRYKQAIKKYQQLKQQYSNYCYIITKKQYMNEIKISLDKIVSQKKKSYDLFQLDVSNYRCQQSQEKLLQINVPLKFIIIFYKLEYLQDYEKLFNNKLTINYKGEIFCWDRTKCRDFKNALEDLTQSFRFEYVFSQQQEQLLEILNNESWKKQFTNNKNILLITYINFNQICEKLNFVYKTNSFTQFYDTQLKKNPSFVYLFTQKQKFDSIKSLIHQILSYKFIINISLNNEYLFQQYLKANQIHKLPISIKKVYQDRKTKFEIQTQQQSNKQKHLSTVKCCINKFFHLQNQIILIGLDRIYYLYFQSNKRGVQSLLNLEQKYFIKFQLLKSNQQYNLDPELFNQIYFKIKMNQKMNNSSFYLSYKGSLGNVKQICNELQEAVQNINILTVQLLNQTKSVNWKDYYSEILMIQQHENKLKIYVELNQQNQPIKEFTKNLIIEKYKTRYFIEFYQNFIHRKQDSQNLSIYQQEDLEPSEFEQFVMDFSKIDESRIIQKLVPLLPKIQLKFDFYKKIAQRNKIRIEELNQSMKITGNSNSLHQFIKFFMNQQVQQPIQWENHRKFQLKQINQKQKQYLNQICNIRYKSINRIQNLNARSIWQKKVLKSCLQYNDVKVAFVFVTGQYLIKRISIIDKSIEYSIDNNNNFYLTTYTNLNMLIQKQRNYKKPIKQILICHCILFTLSDSKNKCYLKTRTQIQFYQQNMVLPLYMINL